MAGTGGRQTRKPVDYDFATANELRATCNWNPKTQTAVCRLTPDTHLFAPCEHVTSSPAYSSLGNAADEVLPPKVTVPRNVRSHFVKTDVT